MPPSPRQDDLKAADRPLRGTVRTGGFVIVLLVLAVVLAGCAKYNTYFNAKRAFDNAEHVRNEALRKHQDPPKPGGQQKNDYEEAIRKAQKILDDYPGHGLTDDALFLQAKAYHRLESYRMSIRKLDLLFTNFPASEYLEESLYIQGLNHLLIGSLPRSQEYLDRLAKKFPESRFQAETRKVTGDNAYALENWEAAAASYREYLAQETGVREPDRIGLKLATCYWELERYEEAARVLDTVAGSEESTEIDFQARLLSARVHVKLGEYALVDDLVAGLKPEAGIYRSEGMVALVEAENFIAQGRGEDASPVLENMPLEWQTPAVKARAADILGYELLRRGQWEDAKVQFQEALRQKDELDDLERTRRLNEDLNDYLAAEAALKDAQGDRAPRLRVLQANALLFGLGRPGQAAALYQQAAADTAADSTDAARALYGAMLAYRDHLAQPDSAEMFAQELQRRYPDSPQAFEARSGDSGEGLLGYLMELRSRKQAEAFSALTEEELLALQEIGESTQPGAGRPATVEPGLRRRMVYLARRDNLVFPPPREALERLQRRTVPAGDAGPGPAGAPTGMMPGTAAAPADSAGLAGFAHGDSVRAAVGEAGALVPPGDPGQVQQADSLQAGEQIEGQETDEDKKDEDKKDEEEKKKKLDENWDFLR
ncbi:MAG: tetratricopeptide repeat protein [bacterium]